MRLLYQIPVAYCKLPDRDENSEAVRKVEKPTNSEPLKGEDQLFHQRARSSAFRRRGVRQQSRSFALHDPKSRSSHGPLY